MVTKGELYLATTKHDETSVENITIDFLNLVDPIFDEQFDGYDMTKDQYESLLALQDYLNENLNTEYNIF